MIKRLVAGVVATILVVICSLKLPIPGAPPYVTVVFYAVAAVALATLLAVIEVIAAGENKFKPVFALPKTIETLMGNIKTCQYVGSANDIVKTHFSELRSKAEASTEVLNTLVFFGTSDNAVAEYLREMKISATERVQGESFEDRRDALVTLATKKGEWKDIVSEQTLLADGGSLRRILDRWGKNDHYEALVLKDAFPVVNMILFKGPEPEVWFGFGLFPHHVRGHVFKSNAPTICEYFENYWKVLEKASDKLNGLKRMDVLGAWIEAAYRETDEGTIHNISAISITVEEQQLVVHEQIFRGDSTYQGQFEASAVVFGDDMKGRGKLLRYSYLEDSTSKQDFGGIDDGRVKIQGAGWYHFLMDKPNDFHGEFFHKKGGACEVYGQRVVDNADAAAIMSQDVSNIDKVIKKLLPSIRTQKPMLGQKAFLS